MRALITLFAVILPALLHADTLFYYSPKNGNGGLRFAVEETTGKWSRIGKNFNFVSSDFGSWGSGKKMFDPLLLPVDSGWELVFSVNKNNSVYGVAKSSDLMNWKPQEYYNPDKLPAPITGNQDLMSIIIGKDTLTGRTISVDHSLIENLRSYAAEKERLKTLYSERTDSDAIRFKELTNLKGTLNISSQNKEISPILLGIFFEDINYSADGGLYAELIQNRDFEYKEGESRIAQWGPSYGWNIVGNSIGMEIRDDKPLSPSNPHYARLISKNQDRSKSRMDGLYNPGYDGISLKKDETYHLRFKARSNKKAPLEASLVSSGNLPIAAGEIIITPGDEWQDYEYILVSDDNYRGTSLKLTPLEESEIDIDMVSLFPENTFKGRENGLRPDLAQALADLKPGFVRFPGGCVAHGNGLDNVYDWKGSIGELENRKPLYNLWGYHQTRGLGYHEYFLFCEDIGAEPVPVLAAGVPCQNSSRPSRFTVDDLTLYGQQQGLPMDSLDSYIQDILDLIEYANGPATSEWGSKRAMAGHPEPFNLKYIGIGNEDMITEVFKERFEMINDAVKKAYPEITVIGTTGPFYEGADYDEGWAFARKHNVDMVDEHYYVDPAWLIYNQDFYEDYDREGPKVYLGEWAAHLPDRSSTVETALAEALYITALEKNGDVVRMSSYAPLLAKKNHIQWRPDLIYFDNDSVYPTTDYHVFRLAGNNTGDLYYSSNLSVASDDEKAKARTAASVVRDSASGEYILKVVNLLPVELDLDIDLRDISGDIDFSKQKDITIFTGKPSDKLPVISRDKILIEGDDFKITSQPYSFTIIRL